MGKAIVVGAGPAGAALAQLLASRGVEVALLERHRDFAREFRGELLLPGGLDALDQMGLWSSLEVLPQFQLGAVEFYVDQRLRVRGELEGLGFGRISPRWISQPALLEMLVAEAEKFPGFHFERGFTVRGLLEQDGRCVGVGGRDASGERELRADLVIGADGRSSVVRKRAALPVRADPTPMDIVWCKLPEAKFLREGRAGRFYIGGGHLLVAVPIYGEKVQVAWIIPKGSFGEIRERGMPECLEQMARHVSPDLAAHLRAHLEQASEPFLLSTVSDRVTRWTKPGLMVIGDAAHTMSPVGGQGINIALRDAVVAANHLVPLLSPPGPIDPLRLDAATRAIEQERLPEVSRIQRLQAIPPRFLFRDTWWSRLVFRILPLLARRQLARVQEGGVARRFALGVTDVHLRV